MSILINNQQSTIGNRQFARGFSLTEVLIAVGILAVGMLFIAGVFPVSIHFTIAATERTIAPVVADEAFAKSKIYLDGYDVSTIPNDSFAILVNLPPNEFSYPSTPSTEPYTKKYWFSAIFRRVSVSDVQAIVFVNRKVGATGQYVVGTGPDFDANRPDSIQIAVSGTTGSYELAITNPIEKPFVNDGYTIVDGNTGQIYRVLERYRNNDTVIKLDRPWRPDLPPLQPITGSVWVTSPPATGGRYPCIGVYQKIMRF